jgi:hypothetical protein
MEKRLTSKQVSATENGNLCKKVNGGDAGVEERSPYKRKLEYPVSIDEP